MDRAQFARAIFHYLFEIRDMANLSALVRRTPEVKIHNTATQDLQRKRFNLERWNLGTEGTVFSLHSIHFQKLGVSIIRFDLFIRSGSDRFVPVFQPSRLIGIGEALTHTDSSRRRFEAERLAMILVPSFMRTSSWALS